MCNEPGSEGSAGAKKQELRGKREGEGDDFGDLRAKNTLFVKTCGKVGKGCSFCVRFRLIWEKGPENRERCSFCIRFWSERCETTAGKCVCGRGANFV